MLPPTSAVVHCSDDSYCPGYRILSSMNAAYDTSNAAAHGEETCGIVQAKKVAKKSAGDGVEEDLEAKYVGWL